MSWSPELYDGDFRGRGECVPYPRYGESVDTVAAALEADEGRGVFRPQRETLQYEMAPGAARNAARCRVLGHRGRSAPIVRFRSSPGSARFRSVITAYTLSLDTPERMGEAAALQRSRRSSS